MAKTSLSSIFAYAPDPAATRKRMVAEARTLYEWGLTHERHQPVVQSYAGQLRNFYLYPTFDCPLRCPYCYAEGGTRQVAELDAPAFLRITQEAIDAGYARVVLVGGEPLVYYDFERYLEGLGSLRKGSCAFVLRTSFGFDVSETLLKRLCGTFDEIVVSIDGDETTHDAVRGLGTWRHATTNVKRAVDLGANISINAVMSKEQSTGNPGEFLKAFCAKLDIPKLTISSPVPMGRAAGTSGPYFEWRSNQRDDDAVKPLFSCGLGHSLYVQPDGRAFACYAWCEPHHQLGDLATESLADVLNRGELLSLMNTGVDSNEKCRTCVVRYLCGGQCKIWVTNKDDVNGGDFDCEDTKQSLIESLVRRGVISTQEAEAAQS